MGGPPAKLAQANQAAAARQHGGQDSHDRQPYPAAWTGFWPCRRTDHRAQCGLVRNRPVQRDETVVRGVPGRPHRSGAPGRASSVDHGPAAGQARRPAPDSAQRPPARCYNRDHTPGLRSIKHSPRPSSPPRAPGTMLPRTHLATRRRRRGQRRPARSSRPSAPCSRSTPRACRSGCRRQPRYPGRRRQPNAGRVTAAREPGGQRRSAASGGRPDAPVPHRTGREEKSPGRPGRSPPRCHEARPRSRPTPEGSPTAAWASPSTGGR